MNVKCYALIVAGGIGNRMNSDIPKQFMLLSGKPVLMHTITAFSSSKYSPEIVVVLNAGYINYWEELCGQFNFYIPHKVVPGGENRFYSVKNGLEVIEENTLVAVHDAVRPLITDQTITMAYEQAYFKGNACCAINSRDSIRQKQADEKTIALNREFVYLMQTPQTFKASLLKNAYQQTYRKGFTDEATVLEQFGETINIVEGETNNIKITFSKDLAIADILLKKNPTS